MNEDECTVVVFNEGGWRPAATLPLKSPRELGYRVPIMFIYLTDYALDHLGQRGASGQMLTDHGVPDDIRRRLEPGILANVAKLQACANTGDRNG